MVTVVVTEVLVAELEEAMDSCVMYLPFAYSDDRSAGFMTALPVAVALLVIDAVVPSLYVAVILIVTVSPDANVPPHVSVAATGTSDFPAVAGDIVTAAPYAPPVPGVGDAVATLNTPSAPICVLFIELGGKGSIPPYAWNAAWASSLEVCSLGMYTLGQLKKS